MKKSPSTFHFRFARFNFKRIDFELRNQDPDQVLTWRAFVVDRDQSRGVRH